MKKGKDLQGDENEDSNNEISMQCTPVVIILNLNRLKLWGRIFHLGEESFKGSFTAKCFHGNVEYGTFYSNGNNAHNLSAYLSIPASEPMARGQAITINPSKRHLY